MAREVGGGGFIESKTFFFGHRSLARNNTQTSVINMTAKHIVGKQKLYLLLKVSCVPTYILRRDRSELRKIKKNN